MSEMKMHKISLLKQVHQNEEFKNYEPVTMEQQFAQLETLMTGMFDKIEDKLVSMENRLISLEHAGSTLRRPTRGRSIAQPLQSLRSESIDEYNTLSLKRKKKKLQIRSVRLSEEDTLTCVQCLCKYREQENTHCSCIYHSGELYFNAEQNKFVLTCCQVPVRDRSLVRRVPGCTKAKHVDKHHTEYNYTRHFIYMSELSMDARQLWLTVDITDPVTQTSQWGEVGLSCDGQVYVLVGYSREQPLAYREFTVKQLKEVESQQMELIRKSSSTHGWTLSASLFSSKAVAKSITVSVKCAGYKGALTRRVQLIASGTGFGPGPVDTLSDPTSAPAALKTEYQVPADNMRGPVLQPGPDLSLNCRNNYPYVRTHSDFPISLTQVGSVTVDSSHIRLPSGKWNNLFSTRLKVSNSSDDNVIIRELYVDYLKGERWVRCCRTWVAIGDREMSDVTCFPVTASSEMVITIRAAISVPGALSDQRARAHFSLPQPLHLTVTCVGLDGDSVELRFEQGNPPLSLVSREDRCSSWAEGRELVCYVFADDSHSLRRSDVALYYNDDGILLYRCSPYGIDSGEIKLTQALLLSTAHLAKKHHNTEQEIVSLKREQYESRVRVCALVDLELRIPYALKVLVNTPSSYSIGYYKLPHDDFSKAILTLQPDRVEAHSSILISWSVPRASKYDTLCVCSQHTTYSVSELVNDQAATTGAQQLRVPGVPGVYEVRYRPAWLAPCYTGQQHRTHVLQATLVVTPKTI